MFKKLMLCSAIIFCLSCGGSKKTTTESLTNLDSPKTKIKSTKTTVANTNEQQFVAPIVPYSETNAIYKKQTDSIARLFAIYPLRDSSNNEFVGTINFSARRPNYVVIHHTAQNSCAQTLQTFTVTHSQVSAHYVICREGKVYHMLNDLLRAWHGGNSRWGSITDMNSGSIGIELDNNGMEPFSTVQMKSLLTLLQQLKNAYAIPQANFIGHSDIAPTRKNDPSKFFPWKTLAEKGFGNWYDTTKLVVPNNFNAKDGLRLIGYDVRNERMAIKAFKLHFINTDTSAVYDAHAKKIIYSLSQRNIN
jgi:N-acetylmuramoyl-L-alanine amidase